MEEQKQDYSSLKNETGGQNKTKISRWLMKLGVFMFFVGLFLTTVLGIVKGYYFGDVWFIIALACIIAFSSFVIVTGIWIDIRKKRKINVLDFVVIIINAVICCGGLQFFFLGLWDKKFWKWGEIFALFVGLVGVSLVLLLGLRMVSKVFKKFSKK